MAVVDAQSTTIPLAAGLATPPKNTVPMTLDKTTFIRGITIANTNSNCAVYLYAGVGTSGPFLFQVPAGATVSMPLRGGITDLTAAIVAASTSVTPSGSVYLHWSPDPVPASATSGSSVPGQILVPSMASLTSAIFSQPTSGTVTGINLGSGVSTAQSYTWYVIDLATLVVAGSIPGPTPSAGVAATCAIPFGASGCAIVWRYQNAATGFFTGLPPTGWNRAGGTGSTTFTSTALPYAFSQLNGQTFGISTSLNPNAGTPALGLSYNVGIWDALLFASLAGPYVGNPSYVDPGNGSPPGWSTPPTWSTGATTGLRALVAIAASPEAIPFSASVLYS